jgi:hypothetical protein
MSLCEHDSGQKVEAVMHFMEDTRQFSLEIRVRCSVCAERFRFLGLPLGLNLQGATMDPDGLTARLAMSPESREPHPLTGQVQGFTVVKRS